MVAPPISHIVNRFPIPYSGVRIRKGNRAYDPDHIGPCVSRLAAVGSTDEKSVESYQGDSVTLFQGRAILVICSISAQGKLEVSAQAPGLESQAIRFEARAVRSTANLRWQRFVQTLQGPSLAWQLLSERSSLRAVRFARFQN